MKHSEFATMLTKLKFDCSTDIHEKKVIRRLKPAEETSHSMTKCIFGAAGVGIIVAIVIIIPVTILFSFDTVKNEIQFRKSIFRSYFINKIQFFFQRIALSYYV